MEQLKHIGMEFLEECDGLPLAIRVLGAYLSRKRIREYDWKQVLKDLARSLTRIPDLNMSLYLSYGDLSPQLKQCFLYCSLFPKGQKILQRTITEMWVSEGFISSREHDSEGIAIGYCRDLINWNFIEPTEKCSLTGYMCSMNNVVRSFAEYMAREEALVVQRAQQIEGIIGVGDQSNKKIEHRDQSKSLRRLSIESTESVEWASLQKLVSLRVLMINCKINFKPGDSLGSFSSLRVLHIVRLSESDRLVSSLCQLKHLRYLYFYDSDISRLPENIGGMKFLQYIGVVNCERFVQLPGNIMKLKHLRSLDLVGSSVDVIPRDFGGLTNLRSLFGFPVHTDKDQDWCSLEELAPLFQLRSLRLEGIEKVDASHLAAKALISSKQHLRSLQLNFSGSTIRSSNVSNLEQQQQQQLIQEVYEHLTPPTCLETLEMKGYIGHQLPNWMRPPEAVAFKNMRYLSLHNLASCTRLPDGLCQMPSLERLEINKAPLIRHVGPEFLHYRSLPYAAFPELKELVLEGMVEWSKWEWNDMLAMPKLEVLLVKSCKLRSLPPGLSNHARALRRSVINGARLLKSLENFSSLVELEICFSPKLSKIVSMPRLQKLTIKICPRLSVLEDVPALVSLVVEDYEMKTLPAYLLAVRPWYLTLDCSKKLLKSIAMGEDCPEWNKISRIQHVGAYAEDGGYQRKCSVLYTREPYSLVVNALLDDSEEKLTHDKRVGSDTPSGSTENLTDDELAGSDIPSGSKAEDLSDNELAGSDIPSGSTGEDFLNYNDSELVGIESPREEIIKMLTHDQAMSDQPRVVSICGTAGLGKTSVAKSVCRHIANKYQCKAFISASQGPADKESIIQHICDEVGCPYPRLEESVGHQQLIYTLKEFLQDKRYLIFVDDIWDISVWEMIKPALPDNNQRSGIIATTCKVVVAESIGGVYQLPLLSDDASRILFYRKTYFKTESGCSADYRESTKRVLNKCGRLPLAIITFASVLPNDSPNSPEEWKKVADSIGSGSFELGDHVKNMRRILSRSYDNLPQDLKMCFLYLCTFPEDYVIRRESLVKRWLSEDLIHSDDGQNLQQRGEKYFYELLDAGMIQPMERDYDGKALACRVPVLMTDLIFSIANQEEARFLEEKERIKSFQQRSLSISCSAHSKEDKDARQEKLRLFAYFRTTRIASRKKYLKINKNLRVLELEGSLEEQDIANYIGSSRQLRYLVIASTQQITAIPRRVGNLQFLQTLDLRATSVHELPCTIVILKQLRCLLINRSTKVSADISKLQALEELQDIDTTPDILESICTLPELRVLRIAVRSWDESCGKPLPKTLCKLRTKKLKHLSICTSYSLEFHTGDNDIRKVLQHIEKLEIQHSTFGILPAWIKGPFDVAPTQAALPAPPLVSAPAPPLVSAPAPAQAPPLASAPAPVLAPVPAPSLAPALAPPLASAPAPPLASAPAPPLASAPEQVELHEKPLQSGALPAADGGSRLDPGSSSSGTGAVQAVPSQMRPNNGFKKLSSLSIEVYLLELEGLKILADLPELIFLSLTAKGPTAQRAPEEMVATAKLVVPKGFGKLKSFHLYSRAIGIKFQRGSMENLERLKLSFQASLATDDFSFGVENLSSLKDIEVEIICFGATEEAVKKAVDGIKNMISGNPKQYRPELHIRRTAEKDIIKEKGEVKEIEEEFKGEVKEEFKEVKDEFKGEVEEVKEELIGKVKEEIKEELIGKVKEEIKEEIIGEFKELFLAALDRRVPLAQKEKERIALAQEEEKEKNA